MTAPSRNRLLWLWFVVPCLAVLALFVPGVLYSIKQADMPGTRGETDRYRISTEIVLDDHGREWRNTVAGECVGHRGGNWSTGVQNSISHRGDNPFIVLGDRSLLMLQDLNKCLPSPAREGDVYAFDPDVASDVVGRQMRMPYSHAWRFDNVDDPSSIRVYLQPELFRGGIDGLKVTSAKVSFAGRNAEAPLPFAGEDAFPWLATIPWAEIGHQDYAKHLYRSTFSGFEVELHQLGEAQRCHKFDSEAEGPLVVVGDVWDSCPPWGGQGRGWLIAAPNADFTRVDYSYDRRSPQQIATLYRASWLSDKGAPGVRDEDRIFYWQPELCFDGLCVQTHAARRPTWDGFRLYYPKKNQVVSVRWKSPAVSTVFRRREKSP